MDNKALFRTSMGGFKKEDVVSYIDKLSKDTNRMLAEKDAEIKELNTRLSEAENKASQLEKTVEEKNGEVAQLKLEIEEKSKIPAQPENVTETEDYKALEQKYNALLTEKEGIEKQLESYRDIEGVQRDLGTIIMKAEKSAAEIIAKAKRDAENTITEASRMSDEITQRRIKACTDIADTFDRGKLSMDEAHCQMCEQLEKIKSTLDAFYGSVETGRKAVHECVSAVKGIDCKFTDTNNN